MSTLPAVPPNDEQQIEPEVPDLTKLQMRGLMRLGDVVIPGDREMPSFTASGAHQGIGTMLPYMNEADRSSLLMLLNACAALPKPAIATIVAAASKARTAPEPLAGVLRLANIGIKGVVHSLYWSDIGTGHVHEKIGYRASINEAAYEASLAPTATPQKESNR